MKKLIEQKELEELLSTRDELKELQAEYDKLETRLGLIDENLIIPFKHDLDSNSVENEFIGPGGATIFISTPLGDKWNIVEFIKAHCEVTNAS